MHNPPIYASLGDTWTDYDDDESYGDYTVSGSTATNARSFELGLATVDPWASSGSTNTKYFHGDQIGTTRSMSAAGLPVLPAVYTAFGERISGTNHRYGYAGEWGYQAHNFPASDPIPFLHVGARYYDPSSGRFVQRDRIGLAGGVNYYRYSGNRPSSLVDPTGLHEGYGPYPPIIPGMGGYHHIPAGVNPPWWNSPKRAPHNEPPPPTPVRQSPNPVPFAEWHVRHEGGLILLTFGNYGAFIGELTCFLTGLGWLWGTDRFETGDLLRAIGDAMHRLEHYGEEL
jgi:RHS repeat-associated protein